MPQYVVDEQNSLTSNKNIMTTTTKTLWKIVPNHSEVQFKVKHLVISIVTGSFGSFDGQIETDGDEFDKTVPANSFMAHRLLHLAKKHDVQNEVKELLFKGYFTDGKNIEDFTSF